MVLHLLYCHFCSQRNCSRQIRPRSTLSDHVSFVITALTFIAIQDSVQGCNVSRRTTFPTIGVRHKSSSYSEKRTDNNLPSIIVDVVRNAITEFSACGLYTSGNRSPNTTVSSTLKTATQDIYYCYRFYVYFTIFGLSTCMFCVHRTLLSVYVMAFVRCNVTVNF